MAGMHSLLKRQLKRQFGDQFVIPPEWQGFIDRVDDAYREFDADRRMLEHSLDLSSQELLDANSEMRAVFQAIPDLVFRLDHRGTILDIKAGAAGDLMLQREHLVGKRIQDVPGADAALQFSQAVERVNAENRAVGIEYSAVLQSQESHYEARLVPLPERQIAVIIRNVTERKQSLRLLGSAVEQSTESIVIADAQLDRPGPRFLFMNPAFTRMTGYTAAEAIGQTPAILQGPRSDRAEIRRMRDALGRGESYVGETIAYRKDGTEFQMERRVVPIRNSSGTITNFLAIQHDITERKQAEAALRESTEKFRQLAENITDVFWIRSADMREVHYVSPAFERIWGRTMESHYANPQQWPDAIVPEDRQRVAAAFATLTGDAANISIEYRILRPDGEVRWVHARGFQARDAEGKLIRVMGVITDVTERHTAQEKLRESKRFAESIATNSTSQIYLIDLATGRNTYSNRNFAERLGYSAGQIRELGETPLQRLIHPDDLGRVIRHFAQFADVHDNRVIDVEYRMKHADGQWHWIWARDTVFDRNPDGSARQVMGTAQDITARKRADAELEAANRELVEASRRAGMAEIATNVLHNVGNILNSVNVSAALVSSTLRNSHAQGLARALQLMDEHAADLGDFLTLDPKGKLLSGYLARVAQALSQEQKGMMDELARLTRSIDHIKGVVATQQSYAGRPALVEPVQICDLLEDALRMNGAVLARHRVTVVRQFAAVPPVNLDRTRVLQILVNLVGNAGNAMENGPGETNRITLRVDAIDARGLRISIQDDGEGIAPENLTRIFAHGFTTREAGHGFGLHSCALAAQQMGGTLTAHSDGPGKGATFALELPVGSVPTIP